MMAVSLPCHACTEHCGLMQRNDDEERRADFFGLEEKRTRSNIKRKLDGGSRIFCSLGASDCKVGKSGETISVKVNEKLAPFSDSGKSKKERMNAEEIKKQQNETL